MIPLQDYFPHYIFISTFIECQRHSFIRSFIDTFNSECITDTITEYIKTMVVLSLTTSAYIIHIRKTYN